MPVAEAKRAASSGERNAPQPIVVSRRSGSAAAMPRSTMPRSGKRSLTWRRNQFTEVSDCGRRSDLPTAQLLAEGLVDELDGQQAAQRVPPANLTEDSVWQETDAIDVHSGGQACRKFFLGHRRFSRMHDRALRSLQKIADRYGDPLGVLRPHSTVNRKADYLTGGSVRLRRGHGWGDTRPVKRIELADQGKEIAARQDAPGYQALQQGIPDPLPAPDS